ncbi:CZB domain-containing protein [Pseudoalteromonas atlantica]|uniref:CZB domain-containing protein n=1 Tax=Pseudoalteromonas atlantica TaxID=288 RepID=UPI0037359C94
MDLINFRVGQKTISLKILDILLTERFENNLTSLPNENKSFIGVKDYMETPTPIFDLGIVLNNQSTYITNKQLSDLLVEREKDHLEWLDALEASLTNGTPFNKSTDPDKCEFGKWYTNFKTDNEDLKIILDKFDAPHRELHAMAGELLDMQRRLGKEKAIAHFNTKKRSVFNVLVRLFESAREQINLDYKPIIIFTTKDGHTPHLGLLVDKVEDNINISKEDIKPLDKLTSIGFDIEPQTKNMMIGLIKLEQKHSVLIDPGAIFRPEHLKRQHAEETEAYGIF